MYLTYVLVTSIPGINLIALVGHPSFDGVKNKNTTIKVTLWGRYFITSISLAPPSFPIGLVKTESNFIARSVEADLGR